MTERIFAWIIRQFLPFSLWGIFTLWFITVVLLPTTDLRTQMAIWSGIMIWTLIGLQIRE